MTDQNQRKTQACLKSSSPCSRFLCFCALFALLVGGHLRRSSDMSDGLISESVKPASNVFSCPASLVGGHLRRSSDMSDGINRRVLSQHPMSDSRYVSVGRF